MQRSMGVDAVELQTRHRIAGKPMAHEADVWWVFDADGERRSVWFTCKDHASRVKNGDVWSSSES